MDSHTGYHLQVHQHVTRDCNLDIDTTIDQPYATITKAGTDVVGPGHNLIINDTTAQTAMTPTETILGPTIGTTNNITGVI